MSGSAIPASAIVDVIPGVLSAGGDGLDLNGIMLTQSHHAPIGSVLAFASAANVAAYFGASSADAAWAAIYFAGYQNADQLPGSLLVAQYNLVAVSAYVRGGSLAGVSLSALQAITGTLSVVIDGTTKSGSPSFSGVTSFSQGAAAIQTALSLTGPTAATFTGAIAGTTLTVSAVVSGTIAIGATLVGAGVTAGTTITGILTGTGGTGTYTVSTTQTVASEAMTTQSPVVTYDSISNAFVISSSTNGPTSTISYVSGTAAAALLLTQQTGAILSQGAAPAVAGPFMSAITQTTQDWATFSHNFDPDQGSGNAIKLALAQWTAQQGNRYAYMAWDSDITPTESTAATTSLGYIAGNTSLSGVLPIYDPSNEGLAAFALGWAASLDFSQLNGAATLAFKQQSGLTATVVNQTIAANLEANNYNFYGAYATANQKFTWFINGSICGPFDWADAYIYQIWLNNAFQLALMELLAQIGAIPYTPAGYALMEGALYSGGGSSSSSLGSTAQTPSGPIQQALNFGIITPGVTLSGTQIQAVNNAAGKDIATTLQNRGWYLQVLDPGATVRGQRGSPACTFWYTQGGSVQKITLNSIELQ
jgi:hypothetical protein